MLEKFKLHNFSKSLLGASSIYILGNIVEALLTFALLPILTNNLTKVEYGILSIYLVLAKFFIPVIHFNTQVKISVDYYREGVPVLKTKIGSLFLIPLINSLITVLVLFVFRGILSEKLEIDVFYLLSIPVFVLLQYFPLVVLSINQSEKKPTSYAIFKICNTGINFLIAIFLIVIIKMGWFGQILGYGVGFFLFSSIAIFLLFKKGFLEFSTSWKDVLDGYKYGAPLLFYTLSGIAMSMGDRLVLKHLRGYEEVALYTVAYQIGTVIIILSTGITKSLAPDTFEKLSKNSFSIVSKVKRNIYYLMGGLALISFFYLLLIKPVFKVFIDVSYSEALVYIPVLSIGLLFQGFYMLKSNILFYFKKNNYLGTLAFICAIINVLLNFLLIPKYGIMGACYSTLFTYFCMWTVTWWIAWKQMNLNVLESK